MRPILITFTLIALTFFTSACNTIQGVGQDIQAGGKKLEKSAEKNKNKKDCSSTALYTLNKQAS